MLFRVSDFLRSRWNFVQCVWLGWGEVDLCGQIMSCHAMPVFHGMGLLQIALVVSLVCDLFRVIPFQHFAAVRWSTASCSIGVAAPTFLEVRGLFLDW